jgi:hypothetical protein
VSDRPRLLVLVYSSDPVEGFDTSPSPGVRLIRDYGNGLRLFSREVQ